MTTALAITMLAVGITLVLRAAVIVASNSMGRIRFDATLSILVGFGCCLIGQALLSH